MPEVVTPPCIECRKTSTMTLTDEEYAKWTDPERPVIQVCFPDWLADKRELLMTGTHPECWEKLFEGEDE